MVIDEFHVRRTLGGPPKAQSYNVKRQIVAAERKRAGTAPIHRAILVTHNVKEFEPVRNLRLEGRH